MLSQVTGFISYMRAKMVSDEGATMVEYGIMVALIAVVSIVVIGLLGINVFGAFDNAQAAVGPGPGSGGAGCVWDAAAVPPAWVCP